jgi:hypothetical protein
MNKITADHLARGACIYIRQSTPDQVRHNLESQRRQYGLADRARALGWQDVKGSDDRIEKDPDARVGSAIDLIFRKFAELGSVRQVFFWLDRQQIQLPVARGPEAVREIVWRAARYHAVLSVLKNSVCFGSL